MHDIVAAVSAERIRADVETLVSFDTRHYVVGNPI